jgi:hypothetical protein
MGSDHERSANLDLRLAVCWICGVILAVVVTLAFSAGEYGRLTPVSDDVFKWIGQMLGPICLLVLSRVFGRLIVQQFGNRLNRLQVYRLTFVMSLVYMAFAIVMICLAAFVPGAGKNFPDVKLQQLQTLSNSGTIILVVLLWPILSMLLDYLFPNAGQPPATPNNELPANGT